MSFSVLIGIVTIIVILYQKEEGIQNITNLKRLQATLHFFSQLFQTFDLILIHNFR